MKPLISTWGDGVYWDVAISNTRSASHVILRQDVRSLCGTLSRPTVDAYIGATGDLPSCGACAQQLAVIRDKAARDMGLDERTA